MKRHFAIKSTDEKAVWKTNIWFGIVLQRRKCDFIQNYRDRKVFQNRIKEMKRQFGMELRKRKDGSKQNYRNKKVFSNRIANANQNRIVETNRRIGIELQLRKTVWNKNPEMISSEQNCRGSGLEQNCRHEQVVQIRNADTKTQFRKKL